MSGAHAEQRTRITERRREERRQCSLVGKIRAAFGELPCTIVDVSPHGLRIAITATEDLKPGDGVTITTAEFGAVVGAIRWATHPRFGVELAKSAEPPAPLLQFYNSLSAERIIEERLKFLEMDGETSAAIQAAAPLLKDGDAGLPRRVLRPCESVAGSQRVLCRRRAHDARQTGAAQPLGGRGDRRLRCALLSQRPADRVRARPGWPRTALVYRRLRACPRPISRKRSSSSAGQRAAGAARRRRRARDRHDDRGDHQGGLSRNGFGDLDLSERIGRSNG